jgi:hypothetical protein
MAPSEYGTRVGSRLSMRHEWEAGGEDGSGSQKGTLKGMFKKHKKSKQIELDALRWVVVSPCVSRCRGPLSARIASNISPLQQGRVESA